MSRPLLMLVGPFAIHVYGLCIAAGILVATWLYSQHRLRKLYITVDQLFQIIVTSIITGVITGRLLFVMSNWSTNVSWLEMLSFWQGGFSVLGTLIGIAAYIPWYLYRNRIPVLPILDLLSLYAPIAHAIARFGCLLSGCCYGSITSAWWAITYYDPFCSAPLRVPLHPTQLYSAGMFLVIFVILWKLDRQRVSSGCIFISYLLLSALERFVVDYFRGDREFINIPLFSHISLHQSISIIIAICAGIMYLVIQKKSNRVSGIP